MRRNARVLVTGSLAMGLAVSSLLWHPLVASAEPECLSSTSDVDGDGTTDIVVGVPGGGGRNGAVGVQLSNEGEPFTTTLNGQPGFGTAVTTPSSYVGQGDDDPAGVSLGGSTSSGAKRPLVGVPGENASAARSWWAHPGPASRSTL